MLTKSGNGSSKRSYRSERKLLIQFLANPDFMKKYEEVRALLSQRLSDVSFEKVFENLIEEFLDRHSPVRRKARRESKKSTTRRSSKKKTAASHRPKTVDRSRRIAAAVRDKGFVRDKGRCTYTRRAGAVDQLKHFRSTISSQWPEVDQTPSPTFDSSAPSTTDWP